MYSFSQIQGFITNHGVSGGTGGGLGTLIAENLSFNFRKKAKMGFHVYPTSTISKNIVDSYNAAFSNGIKFFVFFCCTMNQTNSLVD